MRTKFILEIGYNHNGEEELAKRMIDQAADLGAWAVKFQKWDTAGIPAAIRAEKKTGPNAYGRTYGAHRDALELSVKALKRLKKYAEKKGLVFICSAKDFESARVLCEDVGVDYIKLPSQRYHDNKIFRYLMGVKKARGLQIIVSTGMKTEAEILASRWPTCADVVMHCVSKYPCTVEEADIGFMRRHDFYNGYSSHDVNGDAIPYAVIIGAEYIERHYTYDCEAKGSDHKISSDFTEIRAIMEQVDAVENVIGDGGRHLTSEELRVKANYTRF